MTFASYFDYTGALGSPAAPPSAEFLAALDGEEWLRLLGYCTMLRLMAGDVVLPAGSASRVLHLVADGQLESVAPDGESISLPAGAVFGELTFLDGLPAPAEVRALSEAEVFCLSFEAFSVMGAREPNLARLVLLDLGRLLAARLRHQRAGR